MTGPRLDPRPLALFRGGDATLIGGASRLAARRCDFAGIVGAACCIPLGIAGTGGASTALGTGCEGDGSRNVRSDMDEELPLRSSCDPGGPLDDPATELPTDDVDPLLRRVRLVCTSATLVGVVGRDRNAVAAAADERDALEAWFFRKACAAAAVAEGLGFVPSRSYRYTSQRMFSLLSCDSRCSRASFWQSQCEELARQGERSGAIEQDIPDLRRLFSFCSQTCRLVGALPVYLCQPRANEDSIASKEMLQDCLFLSLLSGFRAMT